MKYEVRVRFNVEPEESDSDPEFAASVIAASIRDRLTKEGFEPTEGVTVALRSPTVKWHADKLELTA